VPTRVKVVVDKEPTIDCSFCAPYTRTLQIHAKLERVFVQRINPRIALRGFKPGARGAGHVLGDLESAVMEALWTKPGQTVIEVEERLRNKREIAHTTVLTTLDRMYRKGYLTREKQSKAFVYAPRYTREEFERMLAQEVLGALIGHFTEPALSTFVDLIGDNPGALDQLEAKIREKRRQRGEK
jgi:predicted transcriptional regulator